MRLAWYTLLILLLPSFAYSIFWTQFTDRHLSEVPGVLVLLLGVGLFACTVFLVIVRSHNFQKLGIGGELQKSDH